jgi:hypothetical protein
MCGCAEQSFRSNQLTEFNPAKSNQKIVKLNLLRAPAASLRPIENKASRAARAADSEDVGGGGDLSTAVEEAR